VSDISRGRVNPSYTSAYPIEEYGSWQVRNATRLTKRSFIGINTALGKEISKRALERLGRRADWADETACRISQREVLWTLKKLRCLTPDLIVLVHQAAAFAPYLHELGTPVLALVGHFPQRLLSTQEDNSNHPGLSNPSDGCPMKYLDAANMVGLNSREDVAYAQHYLGSEKTMFVGMGFPGQPVLSQSDEPVVLFVGSKTDPNRAALKWFLCDIWPHVRCSVPAAKFRIVGAAAMMAKSRQDSSVECVGPVKDLGQEYSRAQVVVAPLTIGTAGVKVKVAEAMAHGRPLVATSVGVDQKALGQLNEGAIVVDSADGFARATISLLSDQHLRHEKSVGAIRTFDEVFSYAACYGEFSSWANRLMRPKITDAEGSSNAVRRTPRPETTALIDRLLSDPQGA
jgi:hypothetical protein